MTDLEKRTQDLEAWKTAALAAATTNEQRNAIMAKYKLNKEFLKIGNPN
jgi:hypothetical protein